MFNKEIKEVELEMQTNTERGLTTEEAQKRLIANGNNSLQAAKRQSWIIKFLLQFKDILVIILLIAAIVSIIVDPNEWVDSLIIFIVVIVNAILGVVQESRAEKSLDALKKMSTPISKVIRDGNSIQVNSEDIVPGDIVLVEAGDFIPADARIIESHSLKVDESALTGESLPVEKNNVLIKEATALGDMKNMLYSSTFVTYGRAKAIVVGTGMKTEIGKIASMLNSEKAKQTPLQNKLTQIGKVMGILSIAICALVFLFQMLTGAKVIEAFKTAVALAVAAIPEGLATVVTIILSLGVNKMVKKNAIVKKLPAVETLGCTSIVCSDKTGTLTQNKMTVVEYYDTKSYVLSNNPCHKELFDYLALCCDAKVETVDGKEVRIGDPTETALIDAQRLYGTMDISNIERIKELPFDSERKLMTVMVKIGKKYFSITKGAPDQILKICKDEPKESMKVNKNMAERALRVLGLGIKEVTKDTHKVELEKDLTFVGLIGMIDPAREEVKASIALAKHAGIKTIMITGDHVITAEAIAKNLGIFEDGDIAIASDELQKMSDDELNEKLEHISVYARVAPSDKVRIVKAWQAKGKVVSMTGDGVNDSPALKAADIGCAMGITGTDVSKEAAAMILVDDNFSTIISAVQEGRNIYSNIKKCVKYLLSSNIGEVLTIFIVSVVALITKNNNLGVPLLPIHLLWINLITDSLPAFALGMEESGSELMNEKPRSKNESFFAHHLGLHIGIEGCFIGGLTLASFFIGHKISSNPEVAQTMCFITLSMLQLFHSFNMKSDKSILNKKLFNNQWLWGSFAIGVVLQTCVVYIPGLNDVFKLTSLNGTQLGIALGLAFSIIIVMEVYKFFRNIVFKRK